MRQALLVLTMTLLLGGLLAPGAHAASAFGIPAGTPTLFTLNADRGTLTPVAGKQGRFVLTLSRLDRRGVWFTDRPVRQTGSITPAALFSSWKALGFVKDPPNAVVTLPDGREGADTVAFALGSPRSNARTGTVSFKVSALTGLTSGLSQHGPNVDAKLPRRFGRAAVFIDSGVGGGGCTTGGIALMAWNRAPSWTFLADGSTLSSSQYSSLASVYGTTFGTAPAGSFRLPALTAPAGMVYVVCAYGVYPTRTAPGYSDCNRGELDLGTEQPDAGWSARPDIPSPVSGLSWYQCNKTAISDDDHCTMSQVTLFAGTTLPAGFEPTAGQARAIWQDTALYALLGSTFGGDQRTWFALPTLAAPVPNTIYGICTDTNGVFPSSGW